MFVCENRDGNKTVEKKHSSKRSSIMRKRNSRFSFGCKRSASKSLSPQQTITKQILRPRDYIQFFLLHVQSERK